ncbi:MAG: mechanosensitive ion channel family protein [Treponema sp.]|jgi:small conductance mechanosensitive channel|nr:mechanosensitive ion channel family protein [Treponema sp.]
MNKSLIELWNSYDGQILDLGKNIIISVVIAVSGILASRGAIKLIDKSSREGGLSGGGGSSAGSLKIDSTFSNVLRVVVRYGIFIICFIMILNVFGINTAGLLAVLGAAGIAVGLALKDTLGNIAAGIILLFLGTYRRGDYIEFGTWSGTVKEISLFTTILETPDGIYISAPNSSVWGTPLKNYTRNGKRRMEIPVSISYSDSIDTAFRVVSDIASAGNRLLADPAPQILVQSYGDNSVNIVFRAWANLDQYWPAYWDIMRCLKEKLEEAGLSIPFPQRDIHLYAQGKNPPANGR